MANDPLTLIDLLDAETRNTISPGAAALSERLRETYGTAVLGIIFYGSCFRMGTEKDGILDIFIVVDNYTNAFDKKRLALANHLLPPNVFYYEMPFDDQVLRTKYAVISLQQFIHRTSPACFHTFFWARFAQPCAITYCRDDEVRLKLLTALSGASKTFVSRVVGLMPSEFDARSLWTRALSASYRTELRPEPGGAAAKLVDQNLARYEKVTNFLGEELTRFEIRNDANATVTYINNTSQSQRRLSSLLWLLRRPQGKLINLLRIMKAAFTFDGGVDYVLWKIERHSGVKVEATPFLRKHPLIACWPTVWRLYKAGAFR